MFDHYAVRAINLQGALQLSENSMRNEDTPEEDRQHMDTVKHA